jgi:hypothetical protein
MPPNEDISFARNLLTDVDAFNYENTAAKNMVCSTRFDGPAGTPLQSFASSFLCKEFITLKDRDAKSQFRLVYVMWLAFAGGEFLL